MSRAYRIAVSGSVERIVEVDDGVCSSLELLPVLPKERMRELLAAELARRGFAREGAVASRAMEDGIRVEIDLDAGTVTVRVSSEVALSIEGERTGAVAGDRPAEEAIAAARERLQAQLDAELEKEAQARTESARRELTKRLEGKLKDLKRELDGVINRVTGEALKEKARQMGEIEELVEDAETGALTIKVRL
jgi:hypothetical protein